MVIKVLNLYSGIGGNRQLWQNVEVTAVEYDKQIANIYKTLYPNDTIIIGDAHQFLLDNYEYFDFIWASPPCPTHSNLIRFQQGLQYKRKYPDMKLYQEIIFLMNFCKTKWVVENVISYYNPLIKPFECDNHYFWADFHISKYDKVSRDIVSDDLAAKEKARGISLQPFAMSNRRKITLLNNMVMPNIGLHIFKCAFKDIQITLLNDGNKLNKAKAV